VERLMRQLGIAGAHLYKHWKTTRQDRSATAAPDLVERDFTAAAPNTLWVADLTYIKTLQESSTWRWCWMCSPAR
jgi:putative transposase